MGRPRTKNFDLPPRMRRKGKNFYHVGGATWTPLGQDRGKALILWAEIEQTAPSAELCTFGVVIERYRRDELRRKAIKTQKEYGRSLDALKDVFGNLPLEAIKPKHVRKYLAERTGPVAANRDVAVLSTVFNHARGWGYTDAANPCAGIGRNEEDGRSIYVTDDEYAAIYAAGDQVLKDAMAVAYYTGQRPSDVLAMRRSDIREGAVWVRQQKTQHPLRVTLSGPLKATVDVILARPVASMFLIADEAGQRVTYRPLYNRFVAARTIARLGHIQFRDLRAKAATDLEDLAAAQRLLGHSSREMTEHYVKKRIGERVSPVKRRIGDR